jgi:hypothetical protein
MGCPCKNKQVKAPVASQKENTRPPLGTPMRRAGISRRLRREIK